MKYRVLIPFFCVIFSLFSQGVVFGEEAVTSLANDSLTNSETPAANPSVNDLKNNIIDALEVSQMDIYDVLQLISSKTGLKITADPNIEGKINIHLKDVNAYDALRIVLDTNGLAYSEEGTEIKVMTAEDFKVKYGYAFGQNIQTKIIPLSYVKVADVKDTLNQMKSPEGKVLSNDQTNTIVLMDAPQKNDSMIGFIRQVDLPVETEAFELQYTRAEDIAQTVQKKLTPGVGRIKVDNKANNIEVADTSIKLKEIEKFIQGLDHRDEEIIVETKILQITLNDEYATGVDWEAIVSNYESMDFPGFKHAKKMRAEGRLNFGTLSEEDFVVLLDALDTVGLIRIISNTKVTTVDDNPFELTINSLDISSQLEKDNEMPREEIEQEIKLQVNPRPAEDNLFDLKIKPELVSISHHGIPHLDIANVEAKIKVSNGSTIVIGGIYKDETVESTRKIPLLGDIPFLGFAFRNQGQSILNTEIVVFLTPKTMVKEQAAVPLEE